MRRSRWLRTGLAIACGAAMAWIIQVEAVRSAETPGPRSALSCGKCPDGYAVVGRSSDAKMCPEDDHAVMQCAALNVPRLAVCGSCPEGYVQVGSSSVPARCGTVDGGQMSQCQLENLGAGLPEMKAPTLCPPDCGTAATPKEGGGPVPQFRDLREKEKAPAQ